MKTNLLFLYLTGLLPVAVSIQKTALHKYHIVMKRYTWADAQKYCRAMYTDLATVASDDDRLRLKQEAASKGFVGYAWVGLYNDINSWRWSLNDLPLKNVPYTNWSPGEPNNSGGKEACAALGTSGQWGDVDCAALRPFICYNGHFSGAAKFIGITSPLLTWPEAQAYCRTHHTDLASSLNSSDQNYLLQLFDIQGSSWIGLYRDTWKWSDGTKALNLSWLPGEPANQGGNQNCASAVNAQFNDYFCGLIAYFVCQSMRKQQIIKLQVKSAGSVFDPAVQSLMFEQIKQKLEEKGMLENTTVSWRVQPDGNIFHKKKDDDEL